MILAEGGTYGAPTVMGGEVLIRVVTISMLLVGGWIVSSVWILLCVAISTPLSGVLLQVYLYLSWLWRTLESGWNLSALAMSR